MDKKNLRVPVQTWLINSLLICSSKLKRSHYFWWSFDLTLISLHIKLLMSSVVSQFSFYYQTWDKIRPDCINNLYL